MIPSNSLLLLLILFEPFILQPKAWELNQLCQQTCSGFDCVRHKPTQMELCDELKNNRLKCCSQYVSRNITTTTKPCQEDVKSQLKEKKRKKMQAGWFLNDACQTACYVLSCLFGTKPTEEELCQVLNIRYNDCCYEKYSTTTIPATTENTGGFTTEVLLSDPDFMSASQEHSVSNTEIEISAQEQSVSNKEIEIPYQEHTDSNKQIEIPSTTTAIEEIVEVDDETTTDADSGATKSTRSIRSRKPRPTPRRKSKNQKYLKLPDA